MARVRVAAGARLHVGFQNLSLANDRLYGGVGLALAEPQVVVSAAPADTVDCPEPAAAEYAERAVDVLDVAGAEVVVEAQLPRHVGLGSGTQLALATLAAVAAAHDRDPRVREHAPMLGRGGRSGVGVATFEAGGFVVDAGHPTERFTTAPPPRGKWTVPAVVARHDLPAEWRVVLVLPDVAAGRHGDDEEASMRAVVERADPAIAESLAAVLVQALLPAVAEGRLAAFGDAVTTFGRLNGAWYTDEQGGVYRPPAGQLIDVLASVPAIEGVGQSSWGPAVYAVTDSERADDARQAAREALASVGVDGDVRVTRPRNHGATIEALSE